MENTMETKVWVLKIRRSGEDYEVHIFSSEEAAKNMVKSYFADEYAEIKPTLTNLEEELADSEMLHFQDFLHCFDKGYFEITHQSVM